MTEYITPKLKSGLPLKAKFQSERTGKTQFLRCFHLNPLQIRGVTICIAKLWFESSGVKYLLKQRVGIKNTFTGAMS